MRLKFIAPALASAALIGTAMTGGVATASTPGTTHTGTVATSAAAQCPVIEAKESVKIRKSKSVSSTALGLLPKHEYGCSTGGSGSGGHYNLCGKKDAFYPEVKYKGIRGWVPATCTHNYS
ncbi:hypothetical protein AB0D04_35400 [Streptomyces sp. NPDC048483]|uniref:hypothetical protein n=1 Tax=Streptomyces sp. NPDC048483 TaxID=3154927 RepID=UPI003436E395